MTNNKFALLLILLLVTGLSHSSYADEPLDILIRGGRIVDGTGNPWYHGDVGIRGDRIVEIARSIDATRAKVVVPAKGFVVAPGFIDIHSHSDYLLLEDGDGESKIRQGVTTEILGEGGSVAPLEGRLSAKSTVIDGETVEWTTLSGYFEIAERKGIATNVASYVGIGNVWQCVMGKSFERPSASQLKEMERLVDEAMKQGALGLSSQVMMPPGSLATTDDLVQLCKVVARHGGIYSTHIRNEGTGVFDSVREAIEVGERAGVPVDIIHLKIADQVFWGRMNEVIDLIESARKRGVNVQANVYPYTAGNNNLVSIIPPWAHEGGRTALLARLKDPQQRERIKHDIQNGVEGWYNHYTAVGGDWGRVIVSGDNQFKGLKMDRVMALRTEGKDNPDLLEELMDFLIEEDGSVGAVYAHHTEKDMTLALRQPWCSVGSDGSAYAIDGPLRRGNPHPRNFGTFPRVLGVYVRQESLLTLEDAVRKMTSLNAAKVGLRDRGTLAVGNYADITIFDPHKVIDRATYEAPFAYNEGIHATIVNGVVAFLHGKRVGQRSGRALRRQ